MLHLFRKYQKWIFYVVTFVIIVTFVFFGTYQTFSIGGKRCDKVVFKTVTGEKIKESLLEQMILFLSSEQTPFPTPASLLATNFLNDGLISKELLHSGLEKSIAGYDGVLQEKHAQEQHYRPYVHPQVPALNAEGCWALFAPEIQEQLALWKSKVPVFDERVALFEAERRFPPPLLAQMLRYRERDYANLSPDPRLYRGELSLFGYHNLEDWFGREYIEECAKCVLSCASLARKRGYRVTREEVLCDIYAHAQLAYESIRQEVGNQIPHAQAFYDYFLRQHGYEEEVLFSVVESVLLFKRLLDDVSCAPIVDTLGLEAFQSYAGEYATVEVTQMPSELRFTELDAWKRFELYLSYVAPQEGLALPQSYDALAAIEERAPELVGERYTLEVGCLTKRALEAKVSMRETWEWEAHNQELLKARFPLLERERLEDLEAKQRAAIDSFARQQIVEEHPEWISFEDVEMRTLSLFLTSKMEAHADLPGVHDFAALVAEDRCMGYTEDGQHYYHIEVKERPQGKEVLAFHEAKIEGEEGAALIEEKRAAIERYLGKKVTLEEAMPHRFAYFLEKQTNGLFEPIKREITLSRIEPSFIPLDALVDAPSQVFVDEKEGAYRYRLLDRRVDTLIPAEKRHRCQELLSEEVRRETLRSLLDQIYA